MKNGWSWLKFLWFPSGYTPPYSCCPHFPSFLHSGLILLFILFLPYHNVKRIESPCPYLNACLIAFSDFSPVGDFTSSLDLWNNFVIQICKMYCYDPTVKLILHFLHELRLLLKWKGNVSSIKIIYMPWIKLTYQLNVSLIELVYLLSPSLYFIH